MLTSPFLHWIAAAIALLMGISASLHALLFRRDPKAALGWIVACIWMPVIGPIIYFSFGINRVQRRARRLFPGARVRLFPGPAEAPPDAHVPMCALVPPESVRLSHAGRTLSGQPARSGNTITPLNDGEEVFPAMLTAIDAAVDRVWLQSYIFEADDSGRAFVQALGRAAKRGVDVRVLLDGVGSRYGRRIAPLLRDAGVALATFLPLRLIPPSPLINLRNHRKVLCVDGDVAFTGGINISDRHLTATEGVKFPTAEMHFAIRGPTVAALEQAFADDWAFATGRILDTEAAREPTEPGGSICRVVTDGPDDDLDKLVLLLLSAVAEAETSIRIVTPYFLPPRELLIAFGAAALRGVEVDVLIPARSNLPYVDWATRNMLWEPLQRGVRVWERPLPFDHTKLVVVDDRWSLIGSTNLDPRSLRLNFELGVEIYDEAFGARMAGWFEERKAFARRITLAEVDSRSLAVRLRDSIAWLAWPYL